MACPLKLNCLVKGQHRSNIFQVTLDRTKSIADLRNAIKDEKGQLFRDVDADNLDLYQVSVRIDNKLKDNVEDLNLEESLSPEKELGDIFRPEGGCLHVVVQPPPDLNCWVLGDTPDRIFPVKIAANESVGSLKDAIKKNKKPRFDHVPADTLVLWSVSIPNNHSLPKDLRDVANKRQLSAPMDKLSEVFSDVPREKHIHIIVERTTIWGTADTDRGGEGTRDTISALKNRFESVIAIAGILNAKVPSDSAKYVKSQITDLIYDGRYKAGNPGPRVAPPIQLFHPAFGHFLDALSNTNIIPNNDMFLKTTKLMRAATTIYFDENRCSASLIPLLAEILDVKIQTIVNENKTHADGTVEWFSGGVSLLLKEDKNEFGDPSTQAGLSTARHWAQSKLKKFRDATCCPTFLIAMTGTSITVLGIVITDVVVVQCLTNRIWVALDCVHSDERIEYVARFLSALKLGVDKLGSYYKSLKPDGNSPLESRYFPSITAYRPEVGDKLVDFEYVGYLENGLDCVTLRARTRAEPTSGIVVKFVDRYGADAHELLTNEGLAPKLLYFGPPHLSEEQPSYHGLSMVVMEYIDGQTLATAKLNPEMTAGVQSGVNRALKLLHNGGLVFGDLRPPNIIVTETGEVKLIDFNWAGPKGQVKYPCLLSMDVQWPDGVVALATIEDVHDLEMFKRLFP